MPSSQLYRDGRQRFVQDAEARYQSSKDLEMLRDFLAQNGNPEDAKAAAGTLKQNAGEKWGSKKMGNAEIPAAWIDKLMTNIGNFVAVGDYAMTGAPESVGLAWFAVKLTLSAIQSNYDLYTFFGTALTDISEIMIIIPHYDRLYDERLKGHEWKPSPVVEKLFQGIIDAYAAVLSFSFSVRRHIRAGTLAKLRHGFKDFFGASKAKFEGKMADIAACKAKILEDSQAIFQDKSLHQIDAVKGIVGKIEGTVNEIRSFQDTLQRMHEEQATQWALVLKNMEDIKSTTKPKTPWDLALQRFENIKEALNPQRNTSNALGNALDQRHPGTCSWIFRRVEYEEWHSSATNCVLCISGQEDSGKTTVLATVVEKLDLENSGDTILLYMNCGSDNGGVASKDLSAQTVCNTLLYLLYRRSRQDESNLKLLEDCNKIFAIPKEKEKNRNSSIIKSNDADSLPEFANAFQAVSARLSANIVVALDEADRLDANEQQKLALKVKAVLAPSKTTTRSLRSMKFVVGCRSVSQFYNQVQGMKGLRSIDVGDYNDDDMRKQLEDELKDVPGLTQDEQQEAIHTILKKAGPRFAYIGTIAVPFMREPFQRPLFNRLQNLPEGMEGVYSDALQKMGANYIELLRTALSWSLLAPVPLRLPEIMDAYHGTYQPRGPKVEYEARALVNVSFPKSSILDIEQMQDARGPFLRMELEDWSDYYLVYLQDPPQIRDFCLRAIEANQHAENNGAHYCASCKAAATVTDTLTIDPKSGHLKLALECMRAMNNAIFQRRATKDDKIPLWSQSALPDDKPETQVAAQKSTNSIPEASIVPATTLERILDAKTTTTTTTSQVKSIAISRRVPVTMPESLVYETTTTIMPQDRSMRQVEAINISQQEPLILAHPSEIESNANFKAHQNHADPYESQDDEDKGELNLADAADTNNLRDNTEDPDLRTCRYEMVFWSYHITQAEALWSPAERLLDNSVWPGLYEQLDYWVTQNAAWFRRWQIWESTLTKHGGHLKPLHVAAYLGLTSWVMHLLRNGAEINEAPNGVPETPLQVAADRSNSLEMLQLLLENGADPNMAREQSIPAFQKWLMKRSDLGVVQLMLKHGANPTATNRVNSWTALHCFAWQGEDVAALDLLLNHAVDNVKPNINARDNSGNTPLHVLLWRREVPKVLLQAFVSRGANANEENNDSVRPLQMACLYGDLETLKVLCQSELITEIDDEDKEGDTALQQAALGNHTDCVEFLVKFGADPNVQNHYGKVALHNSAELGTRQCVQILLNHGAEPNILDKHNRTPLFCACLDGATEDKAILLLDTLLAQNLPLAAINVLTKTRRTPLREAAAHGFIHVLGKLIKTAQAANDFASLALNEQDTRKGMTPLHRAAWLGETECVLLLLAANADVTIRDNSNKTALILAYEQWARASHDTAFENIISHLIVRDPKAAVADAELVAVCAMNGSSTLLQQLSKIGADLNRQDRYGWTPIELARNHQQEEAGRFLKQQAAWAGMLPSRWATDAKTQIADDGTTVKHTSGKRICISANKPLPAGLDSFYFEITSKPTTRETRHDSQKDFPVLAIGFCTIGGSAILFPGWPPRGAAPSARSWGYHADDGGLFDSHCEEFEAVATEVPYGPGHTIGCGVDLTTQTMWFTRDGRRLESEFKNVQGRLFPLLGLEDEVLVETNFTGPFLWNDRNEGGVSKGKA
ncbi:hypothetical protein FB567DRAFT_107375 [Paraphoma chrysanthemicola]|uniref:B30.2/SPRY domain-containing protein n=1 Tax=Paraphoma chrysanthemicola TaxID=798071 RepID=A0A8K0R3S0_9PLEO|nr:hypothetical protein FB567DRAFT_107375 [Paraphoma chrysanthemicola]